MSSFGAVGTELRPPLVVVMGMGKGTEGPREDVGALWSLLTIISVKLSICNIGANIAVLLSGPLVDGAMSCEDGEDNCNSTWLRFQFYCIRSEALLLSAMMLLLELGVPFVVRIAGTWKRQTWYNVYPIRGLAFIFIGTITLPDTDWIWYAHVISGFGYFDLYFGTALFFIPVVSFLLSLLPRGYPTSVRTQRPESTFWATVTLISTALVTLVLGVALYEVFSTTNDGTRNVFAASFRKELADDEHSNYDTTEESFFVYQQYIMVLSLIFFLPLLLAAELEVTPVLHNLPELRYLIAKGPFYILSGAVLLISDGNYPGYFVILYTAISCFAIGLLYLGFPAVRLAHETAGDSLSPKTRFYPGLYTFFSVWGVILGMLTIVLASWQGALYDTSALSFAATYQYWCNKTFLLLLSCLVIAVELELAFVFDFSVGGVPIGFDFLRNWIARSFLYVLMASLVAAGAIDDNYYSLRDIGDGLMWVWMVYAIVYFVFYIHLVGSAMLYRWYLANEKWLRKTLIDEELAYEEGYTEGYGGAASSTEERVSLLDAFGGAGSGGGARSMVDDDEVDALFSGALPTSSAGGGAAPKTDPVKRFMLQPGGRIMIHPMKYDERNSDGSLSDGIASAKSSASQAESGGGGASSLSSSSEQQSSKRDTILKRLFLKCSLGADSKGESPKADIKRSQLAQAEESPSSTLFTASWNNRITVPLLVSTNVSKMGRDAAIEVQVWSDLSSVKRSSSSKGAIGGEVCVGEARVALDQLTLGVPGKIQLNAANNPAMLRGTLELVITYEPAPKSDGKKKGRRERRQSSNGSGASGGAGSDGKAHQAATSAAGAAADEASASEASSSSGAFGGGGGGSAEGASGGAEGSSGGSARGTYESAIDPSSGRKYYFNRATGHRTWNKPRELEAKMAAVPDRVINSSDGGGGGGDADKSTTPLESATI